MATITLMIPEINIDDTNENRIVDINNRHLH